MRGFRKVAALGLVWLVASGHVGSPDTWFEGMAGPYLVTVQVVPAGVVPGVAKVYVRASGETPSVVTIQADKFDATGGAPPPEPTTRVAGDDGLFMGQLWIMSTGSNSVTVNVSGSEGEGSVVVPVVIVPWARTELGAPMGAALIAMGMFLFVGLVTIVGAAVREGSLEPGAAPTPATARRARNAMAITTVLLVAALFGGWKWWGAEDESFVRSMYKPLPAEAKVTDGAAGRQLVVSIADSAWINRGDSAWRARHGANLWTPLVEDHGKLMHLFAIRDDMSSFAHLHPATDDSVDFSATLPPLPAGSYRVYADIVHESGFTHTMVTSVEIAAGMSRMATATANPDDSWLVDAPAGGSAAFVLPDSSTISWRRGASLMVAGRPASLRFEVKNADGSPALLEPYMGMQGHAVVQRSDGTVFVHLHPMGTISMASQMAFQMRQPGDSVRGMLGKRIAEAGTAAMQHGASNSNVVSFPYAFPREGDYRIWIQVKKDGRAMTAAFDASVAPASPAD